MSYLSYLSNFSYCAMHLTAMHLILLPVPRYELLSDDEELYLPPDEPEDLQLQNEPPILQQPPALPSLDFAAFMRQSGGNTLSPKGERNCAYMIYFAFMTYFA